MGSTSRCCLLAALVVLLVGCGPARSSGSQDVKLTLAYHRGQSFSWKIALHVQGKETSSGVAFNGTKINQTAPLDGTVSGTLSIHVESVDRSGAATASVSTTGLKAVFNGVTTSVSGASPTETVKLTPDGGLETTGTSPCPGTNFAPTGPGALSPNVLLPAGAVKVGSTWSGTREISLPGAGLITATYRSRLDHFEQLGGQRVAVVASTASLPVNSTFKPGQAGCRPASNAAVELKVRGNASSSSTTWVATASRQLEKADATVKEALAITLPSGVGGVASKSPVNVSTQLTTTLDITRT